MFSQNRTHRCDCCGPDTSLDTNIGNIDWCHILMSYVSFDIKWRIWHQMTHMTSIYDIGQFGRSWCLKKRLDHSNHTCGSKLDHKIVLKFKNWKAGSEYFSFINFENPLYFLVQIHVLWAKWIYILQALSLYFPILWYRNIPIHMVAKAFMTF